MTSVISEGRGRSSEVGGDGLDVTQGEEALEVAAGAGGKGNEAINVSQASNTTTDSLNSVGSENMDASLASTNESAAQSPDSAIGGTPDSTPTSTPEKEDHNIIPKKAETNSAQETQARIDQQPKLQTPNEKSPSPLSQSSSFHEVESSLDLRAGDRLNEDGYEEDDEGDEGDEDDDSLSDPELVVSGQMKFPISQKPNISVNEAANTEKSVEDGAGEVTSPQLVPGQGVSVQVNSQVTIPLLKDGTPSGCESDVEDNDDSSSVTPSPPNTTPAPKHPLPHGFPSRVSSSVKLPDTVTRLDTPHGSSVFLVGTAHFSKESQEDVAETIRTVKPDIVVVELCKARTAILQLDEETILQESRSLDFKKMQMIIRQHGKIQGVLYLLLLSVSAHITKQLGMAPGGEFRTAFAEARKSSPGCLIQLGDRPIQVTLSRALASLSLWHKMKLTWHILTSKEPISKEEVEKCKQRDFIEEMLAEMTGQFPAISEVFVKERDLYLCRSLQTAAQPGPNPLSPSGITAKVVVGVVGIGHVPGIVDHWGKVTDADIAPIMRIPPPSLSSKLLKAGLRISMYGILGYGIYKCLPGPTKSTLHNTVSSFYNTASDLVPMPWRK